MNKYVITVDSVHVYDGYYRSVADAVFGVLRTHALGPHGEHQVPLGKLVSIQALLVARLEPRSTSGCVLRVASPKPVKHATARHRAGKVKSSLLSRVARAMVKR